jgi:hypothetical protein
VTTLGGSFRFESEAAFSGLTADFSFSLSCVLDTRWLEARTTGGRVGTFSPLFLSGELNDRMRPTKLRFSDKVDAADGIVCSGVFCGCETDQGLDADLVDVAADDDDLVDGVDLDGGGVFGGFISLP